MTRRPETAPLTNPGSDRVRSVRRLSGRSARERLGRFLAEGPQAVREALVVRSVRELYITPDAAAKHPEFVADAARTGAHAYGVTDEVLAAMADTVTPQGVLAVCTISAASWPVVLHDKPQLVALMARVRDPGNAGTVVRVADAAGADAVGFSAASVDAFSPKVVRSTAGSLFHLPVVTGLPLEEAVTSARLAGMVVLAADGTGIVDLDDLQDDAARRSEALLRRPTVWIFGNEAWGLPAEDRDLADAVVRVPIHGRAESLNLATAATVCLYASARAHRSPDR